TGRPRGAREDEIVACPVHARVEALGAVDDPGVAVAPRRRLHVRRVRAVVGLGEAERQAHLPAQRPLHEDLLLRGRAELVREDHGGEVADQRDLAMVVVEQSYEKPVALLARERLCGVRYNLYSM